MDKSTHQIRCEQWSRIITDCLSSGQPKKTWCQENGVSEKSFYYWQRILRNEAYIEMKQLPASAPATLLSEPPVAFVELKPTHKETEIPSSFRPDIILRSGRLVLEISNTASAELLKQLGGFLHAQ